MANEKIIKAKRNILQEIDGKKEYVTVSQYTLSDSVEFGENSGNKNGMTLEESFWEGTMEEYLADVAAGKIVNGATVNITDDHDDVEQDPINIDTEISLTSENPIQNKAITIALNNEINRAKFAESDLSNSKANIVHLHDDRYYTEPEMDSKILSINASITSHTENVSNPHNVTASIIGLGNVENKSSATIRNEITKNNVTSALGYTPYTPSEIDNKLAALETNIDWKESVATYADITKTYPNPADGWTVNVKDTDYTYRYNGTSWVAISANSIPKATNSVDGLLSKEDHINYDDANSKKHDHSNKSIIDNISSTNVSNWNAAKAHADSLHAPSNAQANIIETVKVNGTALTPTSKSVNVIVPTKVSDLTNDSGFKTTDTTYTGSNGITITGTNITNSGVRSISEGTTNGTISVNINGSSSNVPVHGLKSGAFTNFVVGTKEQIESTSIPVGSIVYITDDFNVTD